MKARTEERNELSWNSTACFSLFIASELNAKLSVVGIILLFSFYYYSILPFYCAVFIFFLSFFFADKIKQRKKNTRSHTNTQMIIKLSVQSLMVGCWLFVSQIYVRNEGKVEEGCCEETRRVTHKLFCIEFLG